MISSSTKARALTFCLVLLFLIFGSCSVSFAQSDLSKKNVLILYSEDKAHPAHELTDRGIRSTFRSNKLFEVQLYNEYLDGSRFKDPAITHTFAYYLRRKYAGLKIDMIIAVYSRAMDFLLKEAVDVFPQTPIVVTQLTRAHAENLEHSQWRRSITATVFGDNITDFLVATFQMRPGTKRVALVGGINPNEIYVEQLIRKGLKPYLEELEIVDLTRLPMQEILSRVCSLPPDTIILFSNMFTDGAGQNFVPREAIALISRAANVPVFGLFDSYLGYGIVGGPLVSFEEHGKEAVALALRIMGGQSPASIPFGGEQAYVSAYDWQQLKRWKMNLSALPKGSIVINKEFTLWEFRYYIIGFLAFCILETALIVFLVVQRRRKKVAEEDLRQKKEELDQFFNVSLDLLGIATTDACFVRVNPSAERILGYTREELMSRPFLDFVHPDDLDRTREKVSALTLQEKVFSFENRYRCKDGTYRWLQWNSASAGNLIYAAARDVTEQKLIESETRKLREELAHVTQASMMGGLTSVLAHEINQPLTAILSNAQAARRFLSQDNPDMKEIAEILGDIIRDDNRAAEVIRKIRSMLKKEKIIDESLSLNDVIEEILNVIRNDTALTAVSIEKEFDPSLPAIWGDRVQLQQVILNLVMNAAEAMSDAGPDHKRLIIRTSRYDDRFAEVSVMDFGNGIEENNAYRLFDSFYTTKAGGMGMGLAISKEIIKIHRGEIRAVNNPDRGATFSFTVPFGREVRS